MDELKSVRSRYSDALSRISWERFEQLLADHHRQQSFYVAHCGTAGTGGKFDVRLVDGQALRSMLSPDAFTPEVR